MFHAKQQVTEKYLIYTSHVHIIYLIALDESRKKLFRILLTRFGMFWG